MSCTHAHAPVIARRAQWEKAQRIRLDLVRLVPGPDCLSVGARATIQSLAIEGPARAPAIGQVETRGLGADRAVRVQLTVRL
eukprot:2404518-Rhodomonas_salina.2